MMHDRSTLEIELEKKSKVVLHGMWASTYSQRVELALKFKGIPYDYVEEDLQNKSNLLINYNPVHNKVPVLVHNNKPIVESFVILEYIDETWGNGLRLLPKDPYERAKVRFLASFIQQLLDSIGKAFSCHADELDKSLEEVYKKLKVLEEVTKRDIFPSGNPLVNPKTLGVLDILMVATLGTYKALEEVLCVKILDLEENPLILLWVTALREISVVKEVIPPHEKLVSLLRSMKQR